MSRGLEGRGTRAWEPAGQRSSDRWVRGRLWAEATGSRCWLPVVTAVLLASAAVTIVQMFGLSRIIDGVFMGGSDLGAVIPWMAVVAGATGLRGGLVWAGEWVAQARAARVKADLRRRLLDQVLRLGPAWGRRERAGELVVAGVEGIEKLEDYLARYLVARLGVAIIPPAVVVGVFVFDWLSGVVLCVTGPLIPIFMVLIGRRAELATRDRWVGLQRMGAHFLEVVRGLSTLKLYGRSRGQSDRIRAVSDDYRVTTMEVLRVAFLSGMVLELAASISTAVVAVEVGVRLVQGLMSFQAGLVVLLLAPEFYLPFRVLGARHHAGMEGVAAAERIYAILEAEPLVARGGAGGVSGRSAPEVRVEQVSFRYPGSDRPALDRVSLVIEPGRLTALAGPSGSGKSTLVNLLLGFLALQEGEVWVGGESLRILDRGRHLERVALVPQDPHLFNGTVRENLRAGRPEATGEAMWGALAAAGADDFVGRLPDGLDTMLVNNGERLSGGERQRLALARALLKDAAWLILDEPASALDAESEAAMHRALGKLAVERTVLVIAHRLATLRRADRVLLLDHGRLAGAGNHDVLLRESRLYAAMTGAGGEVRR